MTVSGLQLAKATEQTKTPVGTRTAANSKTPMVTRMLVVTKMGVTRTRVTRTVTTRMPVIRMVATRMPVTKMVVTRTPVTKTVEIRTLVDSRTPEEIKTAVVIRMLADNKMPVATKMTVDSKGVPHRQALLALPSQRALQDSKTRPGLMPVETPVAIEVTTDTVAAEETGVRTFKGTRRAPSSHEDRYLLRSNPRLFQGLMT